MILRFVASLTIALIVVILPGRAEAETYVPQIHLTPEKKGHWRADYTLNAPTQTLRFIRPSNGMRPTQVRILDPGFVWARQGEDDVIVRADGAPFRAVSIAEATEFNLPEKDYLPFAQFGDGGLLIYTGRFHACGDICPLDASGDQGPFRITINPGERLFKSGGAIVAHGKVATGAISFTDRGDGTKIYVGNGTIKSNGAFVSIIDRRLPRLIRHDLERLFPVLMEAFAERLGPLPRRPMLFVSYNVPGTVVAGSSIKGGALPDQVFMHFEGAETAAFSTSQDFEPFIAWFFAHEAAHLYQRGREMQRDEADSWIHEGGAEALAALALTAIGFDRDAVAARISEKSDACAKALKRGAVASAYERRDFDTFYSCGLMAHLSVHDALSRSGSDLFAVWRNFMAYVADGGAWSGDAFMAEAENLGVDPQTLAFIRALIDSETPTAAAAATGGVRHYGDQRTIRRLLSAPEMRR